MKLNCIKEVLDEKGISQTWLAKKLDKSFNSVNAYVCNRTQPNLETLLQISQILNVDMKDLIADQEQINNN
jgi:transcriptional regulator with XRE-family HTH domain